MTIHAVILSDPLAVTKTILKSAGDEASIVSVLIGAQPHVTTTDRDGAIALAREHGARVILIDGVRLQVVTSHDLVAEGETAGAPAKAPEPAPVKQRKPRVTKDEVDKIIAADAERFKAAVAIGTPLEHLKNPHRPSSRAGQAWTALVRAHEERLRAAKVDGATAAVGK